MAKKKKSRPPVDSNASAELSVPPAPKPVVDPKWVWPPFPSPPEGVTIIGFHQFEPKGIVVSLGDEPEVDGEGIRTVELLARHTVGGGGHRKAKVKKGPFADITDEELRKLTWDKRWELGEHLRKAQPMDPMEPLEERFKQSVQQFLPNRQWDPSRQQLWDQWRLYVGIISGVKKPQGRKSRLPEDDERPLVELNPGLEDDMSEEEDLMEVDSQTPIEGQVEEGDARRLQEERLARDYAKYERMIAAKDERTLFWVTEPEKATKIFLSSHFRDRGLMWSEPQARDMPLLLCFYLSFVLRNKMFPEKDFVRGYEKALVVAQRACSELLYTFRISRALPDKWGHACKNQWGQKYHHPFELYFINSSQANHSDGGLVEPHIEHEAKLVAANYDLGDQEVEEKGDVNNSSNDRSANEAFLEEVTAEDIEPVSVPIEESPAIEQNHEAAAEIEPTKAPSVSGWGDWDADFDPSRASDLARNWGMQDEIVEDTVENAWGEIVLEKLTDVVDETLASSLIRSAIPIRAEKSTRRIIDILPPDPTSSNPMTASLATLVLQPWPIPDTDPDALVQPPVMIDMDPEDAVVQASKRKARSFDPSKHDIRVYIHKEAASECKVGMGVGAVWVQVDKRVEPKDDEEEAGEGKRKKGKSSDDEWWYVERLEWAIPGYWTVGEAHRDFTRHENHPEYAYAGFSD